MLKMDEDRFAEINFIRSADKAASLLVSDDNVNILSSYSTRKEILQEQFERLTFELMLPSEMHYSLLNYQLTGDEQGSIEFLRLYRNKVKDLLVVYDDIIADNKKAIEDYEVKSTEDKASVIMLFHDKLPEELRNMVETMKEQSIKLYSNTFSGEIDIHYYASNKHEQVKYSMHEATYGYADMIANEPYMVDAVMKHPLDESVMYLLDMQHTLMNVQQDSNLYPIMETYFVQLFYTVVKGSESMNVFDERGIVKDEYQQVWKSISNGDMASPLNYLVQPIIDQMEASGWKSSKSLDEFNSEEISEVLELAKEGELRPVKTEEIINELKLHDSKGIEFTIPFSSISDF